MIRRKKPKNSGQIYCTPNSEKKVIQKEKHFNRRRRPFFWSSPNFGEKALWFSAKTFFFFGLYSISWTELRDLHYGLVKAAKASPMQNFTIWVLVRRPCACGSDVKVVDQLSYVWIVCLFCSNIFRNTSTWVVLKRLFFNFTQALFCQYFVVFFE